MEQLQGEEHNLTGARKRDNVSKPNLRGHIHVDDPHNKRRQIKMKRKR